MELLSRRALMAARIRVIRDKLLVLAQDVEQAGFIKLAADVEDAALELEKIRLELMQPARGIPYPRTRQSHPDCGQESLPF